MNLNTVTKILLAEDDADDRYFFSDSVAARADVKIVHSAGDGIELLEILNGLTEHPDVIVLDQNMPRMNGYETLKNLKSSPGLAEIPVIIYSTYANQDLINKGLSAGAVAVLPKPEDKRGYNSMIADIIKTVS